MKATIQEVTDRADVTPVEDDFAPLSRVGLGRRLAVPYLPNRTYLSFLCDIRPQFPALYALLSGKRAMLADEEIARLNARGTGFAEMTARQLVDIYRKPPSARDGAAMSALALLDIFSPRWDWNILNVGGDGSIARAAKEAGLGCRVITASNAAVTIATLIQKGLPAIRQAADFSFFSDESVDGVLYSPGTLDDDERDAALAEAHRTLKPGRHVVMCEESATTELFRRVVYQYARHDGSQQRIRRAELPGRLNRVGFENVRTIDVPNPCVAAGVNAATARQALLLQIHQTYDLVRLASVDWQEILAGLINMTWGPTDVYESDGEVVATVPRTLLVTVGTK